MSDARRTVTGVALAVAVTAYGWWAVGLAAFSAGATVAVVVAGVVAMVVGGRARRRGRAATTPGATTAEATTPGATAAGATATGATRPGAAATEAATAVVGRTWPWFVVVGVLACVQVIAYVQQPRDEHPTLSSLTNAALDTHVARAVAFLAWLAAAVELARR